MDPNDPNDYDEKALRRHIERVEAYSYCDGIMRWCPCGDKLVQQIIDGTRYILCEKHKYDDWLHYRRRWDEVVWEQVVCLKAENEKQEKEIRGLSADLHGYKWQIGHLKAEVEKQERLIRELICDRDQNKRYSANLKDENEKNELLMREVICDLEHNKRDTANLKEQLDHLLSKNLRELTLGI